MRHTDVQWKLFTLVHNIGKIHKYSRGNLENSRNQILGCPGVSAQQEGILESRPGLVQSVLALPGRGFT